MYKIISILVLLGMGLGFISCERKSDYIIPEEENPSGYEIIEDNGEGTGTVTWTKDKKYLLKGRVFVNKGQTLSIEAGTVIRAQEGQGSKASALIVAQGGKIIAEGTETEPIIFTSVLDDLHGSLKLKEKGLWGGLIILGYAPVNSTGDTKIEGLPIIETRAIYGGSQPNDNSGVLKYVSIRHGGTDIGEDNEINGLTLGGVGDGTQISHIEVVANADDGIEIFGGTVNLKNIIVAYCKDDAFDFEQGWSGKGQFWVALQDEDTGGNLTEMTLGNISDPAQKYPNLYNLSFIGRGTNSTSSVLKFMNNAAGEFHNSIFMKQGKGISIKASSSGTESFDQWEKGFIKIENNLFYQINEDSKANFIFAEGENVNDINGKNDQLKAYFTSSGNLNEDPKIEMDGTAIKLQPNRTFETTKHSIPGDSWFEKVDYKGAVGPNNWTLDWTLLSKEGFIK